MDFILGRPVDGDGVAHAGEPLDPDAPVASREEIIAALRTVYDPEIPVNIYDLGLVYALDVGPDGNTAIEMTLTAPGCPVAGQLPTDVAEAVAAVEGVGKVEGKLVWEPA